MPRTKNAANTLETRLAPAPVGHLVANCHHTLIFSNDGEHRLRLKDDLCPAHSLVTHSFLTNIIEHLEEKRIYITHSLHFSGLGKIDSSISDETLPDKYMVQK